MFRKILIAGGILLFTLIMIFGYFSIRKGNIQSVDPVQAVPVDAALIIRSGNLSGFINQELGRNLIWKELLKMPPIQKINRELSFIDSLTMHDPDISGYYKRSIITVSLHKSGKDRYEYILYVPLENMGSEKQISKFIKGSLRGDASFSERKYSDTKVIDISFSSDGENREISYSFMQGLFILSPSPILVEEAIRQTRLSQSVADSPGFTQVEVTAGRNVAGNIFVNFSALPDFVSLLFKGTYRNRIQELSDFAEWSELDANIRDDAVLLNGFTYAGEQSEDFLNIILGNQPQKIDIERIVPENVAAFLSLALDDFETFKEDFLAFQEMQGKGRDIMKDTKVVNDKYKINLDKLFLPLIDHQVAFVLTDIKNQPWEQNVYFVMKTKSRSQAAEKLVEMLHQVAAVDGVPISSLVFEQKVANDINFTFYQIPVSFLPGKLFGPLFSNINSQYCAFFENYLVFGNSVSSLSKYLHANILQNNLGSDLEFNKFSEFLSSRANLYFYLSIPHAGSVLNRYLNEDIFSAYLKEEEHFNKFQALAFQLSSEGEMAYNNVFLKFSPVNQEDAQTVWESKLESPVDFKPALVVNHNTGEKEIFVQDKGNIIYLINSSGRILWKQQLEEKILGDIHQIDFYKNGKLQFLFNTRSQLHLLDRNGNYVERYPVKLRSPATNGLAVFDYEKSKNYRLMLACEDKGVYLYNHDGSLIKDWEFGRTEGNVHHPIQHFRIADKDYIVFADQFTVYILNRRGGIRVKVNEHFPVSENNFFRLESNTTGIKPRLAITDSIGRVHFIYFDGITEKTDLGKFSGKHYFDYQDLDGNGRKEFIFSDGRELKVFGADKKELFSTRFRSGISHRPIVYQFSATDSKIGIVLESSNEIYLVNNEGSTYKSFPLRGASLFSIGNFKQLAGKFNLIVGNEDNFLYNYAVQ